MESVADMAATALMPIPDPSTLGADYEREGRETFQRVASSSPSPHAAIQIVDVAGLQDATNARTHIGETLAKIDAFFDPVVSMAFKLHRALTSRRNTVRDPWERLDTLYANGMSRFKAEQDRIRREEEQRQAEIRRQEEEQRMAAEAALLESAGEHALAASTIEQAIAAPAPIVVLPDVTKAVEGLKFRRVWKWRYRNNDRARALQLVPREYLCVDEKKVGAYVRSMEDTAKIPGIEVYYEDVPVR